MDFKFFNEFRKYGNIADFFKKGEYLKSCVLCMLLNGRSLKGEKKNE
uniref:Uncharacterized protein n=1 Tax=Podoviridae sp. ct1ev3 TaxID=2825216 RepID=A0A8S5TT34_9CAUD|nr:MAG TPA: hypothetical protein [Podoviridae sp. ct1ev3]